MSELKQRKFKYDNPADLLYVMIRGMHLKFEGNTFHFNKKECDFISTRWGSVDTAKMCSLLVGNDLTEVEPASIPVDTLLLVSDEHLFEKGETPMKPPSLRYFSHWYEGILFCFSAGATSMTAKQKTTVWRHYKHYDPIIAPDNTKENNNV